MLSYAKHFDLEPHFRLNSRIQQILFDDEQHKWTITIQDESPKYFDKVVIAIGGLVGSANMPSIEGLDNFTGISIHSQNFKQPKKYAGKRVMVVGFGNSAADTATQSVGIADKVYIAHRHGARLVRLTLTTCTHFCMISELIWMKLPRRLNNMPIDHALSLRLFSIQNFVMKHFPKFGERTFDRFVKSLQDKSFKLRPEWGFEPAQRIPIVSDTLCDYLESGKIESVKGFKRVVGGNQVELEDGTRLDVDVLIWCTGYKADFSMLDPRFDPTVREMATPTAWSNAGGLNGKSVFRMYHNVFSVEKPESLAFLGCVAFPIGGFHLFDWASMAIAQVWAGRSQLPSKAAMNAEVDERHAWLSELAASGSNTSPGTVKPWAWTRAMDDLGGTGVNEYLGYGLRGWWFWLTNMAFSNLMMAGILTPAIYRVFDGKRKKWDGARQAIEKINAEAAERKANAKKAKQT